LVAVLAAAFLGSWVVQGLTYAVLREISPPVGARNLVDRTLRVARHDWSVVHLTAGQNAWLLAVQGTHVLLGLTTVVTFLAVIWTYEEPKSRAARTNKPLSLDSHDGPDETPPS
jgi:hypothetical protein